VELQFQWQGWLLGLLPFEPGGSRIHSPSQFSSTKLNEIGMLTREFGTESSSASFTKSQHFGGSEGCCLVAEVVCLKMWEELACVLYAWKGG